MNTEGVVEVVVVVQGEAAVSDLSTDCRNDWRWLAGTYCHS